MACATQDVRWSIIVLQQRTSGQNSPPPLLHCLTQICQHFTVVWSSHCCLLWYVIHQQHAFAIPDICGHERGTSWVEESWPFSTALLLFGVWIPMVNPCFITSYYTGQHVVHGCTVDSQQLRTYFHPKWLLNVCQKTWGPSGTDIAKSKWSCKMFKTLPTSVAISRTVSRWSPVTSFSTAWQQSSVVASTGRPARVSSSSDVWPRLNSATHLVTVE